MYIERYNNYINSLEQVISASKTVITLPTESKQEWVKFNWGHTGFYRYINIFITYVPKGLLS